MWYTSTKNSEEYLPSGQTSGKKKIAKLTNRLVENFSEAMIVLLCYYITDMKSRISARMISSEGNQVW